jgi:hypothetical protein
VARKSKSKSKSSPQVVFILVTVKTFYFLSSYEFIAYRLNRLNMIRASSCPSSGAYQMQQQYGPGFDSASNRNEYQEYFLEIKTAGE